MVAHALLIARFPLELAKLPVRSYPRVPAQVSLNAVGDAFLLISAIFTVAMPVITGVAAIYTGIRSLMH